MTNKVIHTTSSSMLGGHASSTPSPRSLVSQSREELRSAIISASPGDRHASSMLGGHASSTPPRSLASQSREEPLSAIISASPGDRHASSMLGGHASPTPPRSLVNRSREEPPNTIASALPEDCHDLRPKETSNEIVTSKRVMQEEARGLLVEGRQQSKQCTASANPLHLRSPFAPEVLAHPFPPGFKLPEIETYDGTGDPSDYIRHFVIMMQLENAPDPLLCKAFPATLKGQALIWFLSLKDGQIKNFAELALLFTNQFIANRRMSKDPSHLFGIRQAEGESLKAFFRRFTAEARQVPGVNPELLRSSLIGGLRPGSFYSALALEDVPSYLDLVQRVDAQIAAENAIEVHRQQFRNSSKRKREQESKPRRQNRKGDRPLQQYHEYTLLNAPHADILHAIRDNPNLRTPHKIPIGKGDQKKYCEFHRGTGHSTEECVKLHDEIERLIRSGILKDFLQDRLHNQRTR